MSKTQVIFPSGKSAVCLSSPASKNFRALLRLTPHPNQRFSLAHPVPHRGAFRDRHGRRERDAMDADGAADESAGLRTAKSCGPDAPTLASSWRNYPLTTVAKKPGHRGEHEANR